MNSTENGRNKPAALALLASERPRNVSWLQAAGLLFGDWGTSRLYVLGLAFLFAGRTSFWLIMLMSLLIVAVGWAYYQICRIYPDGGGVYTAARTKSRTLAVVGALLLFADYTVTASLSALDGFHYFGLHGHVEQQADHTTPPVNEPLAASDKAKDAGSDIILEHKEDAEKTPPLFTWDSPGLWAIIAIIAIGFFNLLGPKHSGGLAFFAAVGMVGITLLIVFFAVFQIPWSQLPHRITSPAVVLHEPKQAWVAFVAIVLALSGVEAIANLTGVMKKPVAVTAYKAIWSVTAEVAIFNAILALCMVAIYPLSRSEHSADMLAFLAKHFTEKYLHQWGELLVRIIGGMLLLSATNTAVNGLMSIVYIVSRDGELPAIFQRVNRFGAPWVAAILATGVPVIILLISHDIERLAALYAIGVIGAIAINTTLCSIHPRLRGLKRKVPMFLLGVALLAIWITLAFTKLEALLFVTIVMVLGLIARSLTKWMHRRQGERPSLLRQAIYEQLTSDALGRPKVLLGTYGSDQLANSAIRETKEINGTLVICFIRQVTLSYKYDTGRLTIDTDMAAVRTFSRFLELGHQAGIAILPVYDMGSDAAEIMAETAAIYGCSKVLIGTSRRGALYHLIKGHFQRRLESILPPEIEVRVVSPDDESTSPLPYESNVPAKH